ncbi:MAG: sugar ABC transporter permease [Treponema sp.]|nr:sugar ABC transporter permease [Treponema sp.]
MPKKKGAIKAETNSEENVAAAEMPHESQEAALEMTQESAEEQAILKKVKIKKVIGHEARTNRHGYLFVLPFIVVFGLFNLWPTIYTFMLGFTNMKGFEQNIRFSSECEACAGSGTRNVHGWANPLTCSDCNGKGKVVYGTVNYSRLIKDYNFWGALKNTFIIWGFNFIPQLGLALVLAIWLSDVRLNLAGKGMFRAIIYMPNLLTAASVALLFRSIFGYSGYINAPANQFLRSLGIQDTVFENGEWIPHAFNFFRSVSFSRGLVAFIQWWMWYGHTLIMLMAGITSIPISLYESATVDGANSRQTAWYITLPLLRPMMLYILVTSMIGGMQMFDIPYTLTDARGNPAFGIRTTVIYQYNIAFSTGQNDYAYGSAVSLGIFVITIFLALLIFFFLQDRSDIKIRKGGAK